MTQSFFTPPKPIAVQVLAKLEPVRNILLTMWALTADESLATDPALVTVAAQVSSTRRTRVVAQFGSGQRNEIATQLSPEQRQFNHLLFAAFGSIPFSLDQYVDFASFLDALANLPADRFQARVDDAVAGLEDQALLDEANRLAADPGLQQQMVAHLRMLWNDWLASDWRRHELTMEGMTRNLNDTVFRQPRWQQANLLDGLRFLLQSEPDDQLLAQLGGIRKVQLVISPYLVGYWNRFDSPDTLWIFSKFDPQWMRRDAIRRVEVLSPLNGLADESRLRILELLTEQGELRAQELIPQLESSQGNVSRHLKQLLGGGYISERRGDGANKVYAYDEKGLQRLIFLLRQLLSNQNAQSTAQEKQLEAQLEQVRSAVSPTLQKFLDEQGRITRWSSKLNDQQAMMEYLVEKFEMEKGYSEKEVNDLLQTWYLDADFVLIRRGMVDAGIIKRTKDGARYWRE